MQPVKEKKERSLGVKLLLKADRCNSPKCVMVRHPYRPGQHGQRRRTVTDYGRQLQEKQKIQFFYGLTNRQMRELFRGTSPEVIARTLQHRLDQVVFAMGFAGSPRIAHQLVSHGHIHVNGRKVTVSSYRVRIGDTVAVRPESRDLKVFEGVRERLKEYTPPAWLTVDTATLEGRCTGGAEDLVTPFQANLNLVVQFYAR